MGVSGGSVLQAAFSLAAVLALVLLTGWAARRRLPAAGTDPSALRLAATLRLDAQRRLHLVETAGGQLLVLTGGGADRMLAWPPARDLAA